jgi:hypothetical protein
MTSASKIAANRRNASRSTGPRSAEGKMRASRNALKYGLSLNVRLEPARASEIEQLATALAGQSGDAARNAIARAAAEAEIEFRRACECVTHVINTEAAAVHHEPAEHAQGGNGQAAAILRQLDQLVRVERYKVRAYSRRNRLLRELAGSPSRRSQVSKR